MPTTDANPSGYPIAAALSEIEYEVKKSRFIARAAYAGNREEALSILQQARADYPDARHHCWAYLIGPPHSPATAAMSDDGEPSGTAGKPILNVLQHKDIGDLMVVVIRYFGGIKLGAGGLVRAYSQAAQQAIDSLELTAYVPMQQLVVHCDFAQEQPLRHWFGEHQGRIDQVDYHEGVSLHGQLPLTEIDDWQPYAEGMGLNYQLLD